jgi:hypothetical protein
LIQGAHGQHLGRRCIGGIKEIDLHHSTLTGPEIEHHQGLALFAAPLDEVDVAGLEPIGVILVANPHGTPEENTRLRWLQKAQAAVEPIVLQGVWIAIVTIWLVRRGLPRGRVMLYSVP